jgi:peptidoglycan/LPS O-acetylase OafA/YrhL
MPKEIISLKQTPKQPSFSLAIEGLRGICVIAVMLFHYFGAYRAPILDGVTPGKFLLQLTNVGWTGVDVFFGISGFVVTIAILEKVKEPKDVGTFLLRRAARLFPVYYLALVVIAICVSPPSNFTGLAGVENLRANQWWAWLNLVNIIAAYNRSAMLGPNISAAHLWSLSVEMQFYLFWPWLFVLLSKKTLLKLLPMIVFATFCLRCVGVGYGLNDNAIYSLTPFRIDAFAFASWLALLVHENQFRGIAIRHIKLATCFAGVSIFGFLIYDDAWHKASPLVQTIGYSALSIFSGGIVVLAYTEKLHPRIQDALSSKGLVWVGKLSYSLYIWHLIFAGLVSALLRGAFLGSDTAAWTSILGLVADVSVNVALAFVLATASRKLEKLGTRFKPRYLSRSGMGNFNGETASSVK